MRENISQKHLVKITLDEPLNSHRLSELSDLKSELESHAISEKFVLGRNDLSLIMSSDHDFSQAEIDNLLANIAENTTYQGSISIEKMINDEIVFKMTDDTRNYLDNDDLFHASDSSNLNQKRRYKSIRELLDELVPDKTSLLSKVYEPLQVDSDLIVSDRSLVLLKASYDSSLATIRSLISKHVKEARQSDTFEKASEEVINRLEVEQPIELITWRDAQHRTLDIGKEIADQMQEISAAYEQQLKFYLEEKRIELEEEYRLNNPDNSEKEVANYLAAESHRLAEALTEEANAKAKASEMVIRRIAEESDSEAFAEILSFVTQREMYQATLDELANAWKFEQESQYEMTSHNDFERYANAQSNEDLHESVEYENDEIPGTLDFEKINENDESLIQENEESSKGDVQSKYQDIDFYEADYDDDDDNDEDEDDDINEEDYLNSDLGETDGRLNEGAQSAESHLDQLSKDELAKIQNGSLDLSDEELDEIDLDDGFENEDELNSDEINEEIENEDEFIEINEEELFAANDKKRQTKQPKQPISLKKKAVLAAGAVGASLLVAGGGLLAYNMINPSKQATQQAVQTTISQNEIDQIKTLIGRSFVIKVSSNQNQTQVELISVDETSGDGIARDSQGNEYTLSAKQLLAQLQAQ